MTVWNLELPNPLSGLPDQDRFFEGVQELGGEVRYVGKRIPWVSVEFPDDVGSAGLQLPNVLSAELDLTCRNCPLAPAKPLFNVDESWPALQVGAEAAHVITRGGGAKIAIVDTGLGFHPELTEANVSVRESFVPGEGPEDLAGHGTAIAGMIASKGDVVLGVAPAAELMILKALDQDGSGLWSWVAEAIERASELQANVMVMALGGPDFSGMVQDALAVYAAGGGIAVGAAGNDGGRTNFPAVLPTVMAVGAVDRSLRVPNWSSRSPWPDSPDFVAPGVQVPSLNLDGGYTNVSGTSLATGVAGGAIALYVAQNINVQATALQDPKWSILLPGQVATLRNALMAFSEPVAASRDVAGYGLIRADMLVLNPTPAFGAAPEPQLEALGNRNLLLVGLGVGAVALATRSRP